MENTTLKDSFAHTITELDNRLPKGMTDCERYGMTWGCDIECPVLQRGECGLNKCEYQICQRGGWSNSL